jgi:hypothetical protein
MNASVQQIWAQLTDPWMYTAWVVGSSHIRGVDPQWPAVGARLHHEVGGWPLTIKDYTEILVAEPERQLVLKARGWPLGEARVTMTLERVDDGHTRVIMDEVPIAGPGKWVDNPLTELILTKRCHECLQRLQTIAENRHSAG